MSLCRLFTSATVTLVVMMSYYSAHGSQWFFAKSPRAVAVVAHGLNLNPSRMDTLAKVLAGMGIDAYRVALSGHDGDLEAMKRVTYDQWKEEMREANAVAAQRAQQRKLPLYLIAYSLGGALNLDLANDVGSGVHFDKAVLFAPSIALNASSYLIRAFKIFGKGVCVPSLSPVDYRANRCTTVAAYDALFDTLGFLKLHGIRNSNIPTLVFIDPRDELVSEQGIAQLINRYNLDQWELIEVGHRGSKLKRVIHHLLIDEEAVGPESWELILTRLRDHLN